MGAGTYAVGPTPAADGFNWRKDGHAVLQMVTAARKCAMCPYSMKSGALFVPGSGAPRSHDPEQSVDPTLLLRQQCLFHVCHRAFEL